MGKAPAFQLYASDFDMDTASWDNEEVGVYFRLLMYQWVNKSIPDDINRLAKITRIGQKRFKKSWRIVSNKFQDNGKNGLVNVRMERVRAEQDNYRESQSEAGRRGIEKKKKEGIFPFNKSNKPSSDPSSDPSSRNQALQSSSSSSSSKKKKGIVYSEQFLKFYSAYPLKKSKAKAFEAWEKHRPDIGVCLAAIQSQEIEKSFLKAEGQFCPEWKYPATWINQQCWEDETEKKPKKIKEYINMPNECKAGPCMNKVDDSKDYCESCQEVLDEAGCKTYDDWQRSGIGQRNLGKILGAIGTKI